MSKQWRNEVIENYSDSVINYRPYEYEEGDTVLDSPRDLENENQGVLSGRGFSQELKYHGWTIREIALLNMARFNDSENDIVGRDIIIRHGYDSDVIRDIISRLNNGKHYADNKLEIKFEDYILSAWLTDSGKRTRYGKPTDGSIAVKATKPKQYKRNRKVAW